MPLVQAKYSTYLINIESYKTLFTILLAFREKGKRDGYLKETAFDTQL